MFKGGDMYFFNKLLAGALTCAALTAASVAKAQSVKAPVLDLPYQSVFQHYQAHTDVALRDWKASNEAVRQAGGWRQYLKESQAADAPSSPTPSEMAKPITGEHSHHMPQPAEAKKP